MWCLALHECERFFGVTACRATNVMSIGRVLKCVRLFAVGISEDMIAKGRNNDFVVKLDKNVDGREKKTNAIFHQWPEAHNNIFVHLHGSELCDASSS